MRVKVTAFFVSSRLVHGVYSVSLVFVCAALPSLSHTCIPFSPLSLPLLLYQSFPFRSAAGLAWPLSSRLDNAGALLAQPRRAALRAAAPAAPKRRRVQVAMVSQSALWPD